MRLKSRIRKRELQPFKNLKRYRRRSTVWNGHVLPFTMIMLPKNSGFQIGERSVSGLYGPVLLSKNARVSG